MLEKNYFAHFSPEGVSPWHWLKTVGYDYSLAGENLAIGFLDSKEVHQAWLESSSHRKNILNPKYQEIGMAVLKGKFQDKEVTVVVQFFGTPSLSVSSKNFSEVKNLQTEYLPSKKEERVISDLQEKIVFKEELEQKELSEKIEKSTFILKTISFFHSFYYQIIQIIIYFSLIFLIIVLFINIFVRIDIQYKDLILKTLGIIGILILFLILDKETMLNLIPHNFFIK